MHICFAALDYPVHGSGGGVGSYVQTLAKEFCRLGHRVSVIALHTKQKTCPKTDECVNLYWIHSGDLHWYVSKVPCFGKTFSMSIRELEYSWAVYNAVRDIDRINPIDIVEGIETGTTFIRFLKKRIKTVIRLHGEKFTYEKYTPPFRISRAVLLSRFLQRAAIRKAGLLTSPSASHAREVENEVGLPAGSVHVIPNPVKIFKSDNHSKDKKEQPRFLFVGRLERIKGALKKLQKMPEDSGSE